MLQQIGYLWAVTAIVWVGTLLYVVRIFRQQTRVHRELSNLEQRIAELKNS